MLESSLKFLYFYRPYSVLKMSIFNQKSQLL